MALTFGAASSDRVNITNLGGIASNNPFSWCIWLYCTTRTNNRFIIAKNSTSQRAFRFNGTGANLGNVELIVARSVTASSYITNDTPLTANSWLCFVITYDSSASAGQLIHIYHGSASAALVESTYGTSTDGSGTIPSDNAMVLGNNSGAASAFQGRIAYIAQFNRVLSLTEGISWQFFPRVMSGCVLFTPIGFNGTGSQIDYSGVQNNGTVTGASLTPDGPPVRNPFFFGPAAFAYVVAAAGVTVPPLALHHYRMRRQRR
jgi:hypothetical protein